MWVSYHRHERRGSRNQKEKERKRDREKEKSAKREKERSCKRREAVREKETSRKERETLMALERRGKEVAPAWKCSVRTRLRGLVRTERRQQSGGNVHCRIGMQISKIDRAIDIRDKLVLEDFSAIDFSSRETTCKLPDTSTKETTLSTCLDLFAQTDFWNIL